LFFRSVGGPSSGDKLRPDALLILLRQRALCARPEVGVVVLQEEVALVNMDRGSGWKTLEIAVHQHRVLDVTHVDDGHVGADWERHHHGHAFLHSCRRIHALDADLVFTLHGAQLFSRELVALAMPVDARMAVKAGKHEVVGVCRQLFG
jgi:hypothetical protein